MKHRLCTLKKLGIALIFALSGMSPAQATLPEDSADLLGDWVVQEGGRKKPYSTFATETLQALSGRASLKLEDGGKMPAMTAITDAWLQPEGWADRQILLIQHLPFKEKVGFDKKRKLFSYNELIGSPGVISAIREVQAVRQRDRNADLNQEQKEAASVGKRLGLFEELVDGDLHRLVPNPRAPDAPWVVIPKAPELVDTAAAAQLNRNLDGMREAWVAGDEPAFQEAAGVLGAGLAALPAPGLDRDVIALERVYMAWHPFRLAWITFAVGGLAMLLTSGWAPKAGYRLGWIFVSIGFLLMLWGFYCRIVIAGRAPVTNMYETVIWVAFGTVLFAMILEAIYKSRVFLMACIPAAIVALILADTQPNVLNSSITPLVPVLRSNFWLSTHVTSITLSYAAFFLALALGHGMIFGYLFGKTKRVSGAAHQYLYRCLQIGVLLLAIGTILGGVWANYSWGRFWDWDPKETWALIALLGYLIILHGRVAGWWGGLGLAVGSVVAFQLVLMAWYGVNFVLGTGLHSYGFGTGGLGYVVAFVSVEFALVLVTLLVFFKRSGETREKLATELQEDPVAH